MWGKDQERRDVPTDYRVCEWTMSDARWYVVTGDGIAQV